MSEESKKTSEEPKKELTEEEIWKNYGPISSGEGPPQDVLDARRKPRPVVEHITDKDEIRVRAWAHAKMKEHESKLTDKWSQNAIVASGDIEAEDVDIRGVYDFEDMHWIIYRQDGALTKGGPTQMLFHIILTAQSQSPGAKNQIILCKSSFATI